MINRYKNDLDKPEIEYIGVPRNDWFKFKGRIIWCSYNQGETLLTGHNRTPTK